MGEQTCNFNSCLSIFHLNIRSLLSDFDGFKQLIHNKFDIAAITETWLISDIDDSAVSMEDYHLFCNDRSSRGGGVAIYYSSDFSALKLRL
nr:unnamed protein product [Callosobruchus analis]